MKEVSKNCIVALSSCSMKMRIRAELFSYMLYYNGDRFNLKLSEIRFRLFGLDDIPGF